MKIHYNLVDEPWIPCVDITGKRKLLNIRETLQGADAIREIHAELPPMTAGIIFLLLAILYRCLHPETEDDWVAIWEKKAFDPSVIDAYLDQWHDRFDLFAENHPFYQDPLMGKRKKDIKNLQGKPIAQKEINGLILHSSSGDAATLFDHTTDDRCPAFSAAQVSRLLVMMQAYSLGGMSSASISPDKYYTDSPHGRGVTLILRGANLFETLLLNLIPRNELMDAIAGGDKDRPAWEMDDPFSDDRRIPAGIMDFLTWQSRRLLLVEPDVQDAGSMKYIYSAPGLAISSEFMNPFYSTYKPGIKKGNEERKLLRFSQEKALWRDSLTILGDVRNQRIPPLAITWINSLRHDGLLDSRLDVSAFGICTSPGKKKAFFYRAENFSYPLVYLKNQDLLMDLSLCLAQAESVKSVLWGACSSMAGLILSPESDIDKNKKANPDEISALIIHWDIEALYWKDLEFPFFHLVNALPMGVEKAQADWREKLRKAAISAFDQAEALSGLNPIVMKASSKARGLLLGGLKKKLSDQEKEEK